MKTTSPEGEVKYFKSFPEAARELGFSEVGVRKSYYAKRDRISEYQLEWLEPELEPEEDPEVIKRIRRYKERFDKPNCCYCNEKLSRRDRVSDCFSIMSLGKDSHPAESHDVSSSTGNRTVSMFPNRCSRKRKLYNNYKKR